MPVQTALRYLSNTIGDDLRHRKMAFLGGPRQVGKTTLALSFLKKGADESHPAYLNWDFVPARVLPFATFCRELQMP